MHRLNEKAAVSKLADLVERVDALSPEESRILLERLAATTSAKTGDARRRRALESDWHTAATVVLGEYGVPVLPLAGLKRQSFTASFRRGAEATENFIDGLGELTRVERMQARLIFSRVLVRWMQKHLVPVSFKAWAQNLANVPTAVDAAFPGYRRAGLLHVLVLRG